ncbi:glycosyltransferase family 1 protein [Sphingomonas oligophenolica]|uniref:Glycosyltransferase family 1 protein n=2 Tax=Sphingomonas oligophenolica TaxID=301154 RepID=A0A502C4N3_9SPHN|nr:glycosyltransferase family 1 protein [Sphingomonas oligophenolica]
MISAGLRVYALAPDFDDVTRDQVRELGAEPVDFEMDRAGVGPLRDAHALLELVGVFRRLRPDIVLSYFVKPVLYGSLAARVASVPRCYALVAGLGYVFTDDGTPPTLRRRVIRWGVSLLYRAAFLACRKVFFQNEDDIADLVSARVVAPGRVIRVNGTGVDLERMIAAPPVTDPPTFVLAARLLRQKGIVQYVEAARIVKASGRTARFLLLGDVDLNPGALPSALVKQWSDEGLVEWPGHVNDVRRWVEASSVFVLPSYYREGVPRSTQEAMALGRAVITTDSTGCRDTVIDGVTGFLVPVRDVGALASAMMRFVDEPDLIATMGRASRALAEERFDIRRINREMLDAMGIIAGGSPS